MAAVELEEARLYHLLRHILAVDTDCRTGGANNIQHDFDHLIYTVCIEATILRENINLKVVPDKLSILRSQIHPIHPIKIDRLIVIH